MSERDRHKATYYSGKKPYLVHNYRTMMKKKTQEEYFFHELNPEPMSELLKPYWKHPDVEGGFPGFEYLQPSWDIPPFQWPGAGGGPGAIGPPYDNEFYAPGGECLQCQIVGPDTIECGDDWVGQVIPSECVGFIQFALGLDNNTELDSAGDASGTIVVVVPSDTTERSFLVCNSGGFTGVTCCKEVTIECCCVQFAVSGSATATQGSSWVGQIEPPCPGSTCSVVAGGGGNNNDYGCSVDPAGTEVTVTIGGSACGTFAVTVTKAAEGDCGAFNDTAIVRISDGGDWDTTTLVDPGCQTNGCGTCTGLLEKYCAFEDKCYAYQFRFGGQCNPTLACKPGCAGSEPASTCFYYNKYVYWTCTGAGGGFSGNC